jgi:hypothetical protein
MKKLSKFPKQIVLIIFALVTITGAVYAMRPFTVGFIRTAQDGQEKFLYGYGIKTYGQPGGTVYGYGYGFDVKDRSNHQYDQIDYVNYGFSGSDGSVSVDSIEPNQTTATIIFSTNYLSRVVRAYALDMITAATPPDQILGLTRDSDYSSGSRTWEITDLTCGTQYYYLINSEDAGGKNG